MMSPRLLETPPKTQGGAHIRDNSTLTLHWHAVTQFVFKCWHLYKLVTLFQFTVLVFVNVLWLLPAVGYQAGRRLRSYPLLFPLL